DHNSSDNRKEYPVMIPAYMMSFAKTQINHWVESVIKASYYEYKVDYDISVDDAGNNKIKPIEYRSTGVIQEKSHWPEGLHQFLQIKHGIKLSTQSLTTSFMSNMGYFLKYKDNIYGLTGTIGTNNEVELLKEVYNVDTVRIPTYLPKKFIEQNPIIANTKENWIKLILATSYNELLASRGVLLICETIKQAELFKEYLIEAGYREDQIKLYTRNNASSRKSIEEPVDSGDIIIATNIAGRGTDIKTTLKVQKNGGLHVILSFLPDSLRVQLQAYGRTAREGHFGTAQMIINKDNTISHLNQIYPHYRGETIDELIYWRDLAEEERIANNKYYHIGITKLKDELYNNYLKIIDQAVSIAKMKQKKISQQEIYQIEELWGIWLDSQEDLKHHTINEKFDSKQKQSLSEKLMYVKSRALNSLRYLESDILYKYKFNNMLDIGCG
ncbi:MAG: hypothetical protein EOP34_09695, partial [Rickettsiales bacterium]